MTVDSDTIFATADIYFFGSATIEQRDDDDDDVCLWLSVIN